MTFWVIQTLNGLSFGVVLFLLAVGLSLIFGLMRIINLAHGSFFLLGAYIGLTVSEKTGSFWLALAIAPPAVAAASVVMQRWFLHRLGQNELAQVLMSFGFLLIIADLSLWVWGGEPQTLPKPALLEGSIPILGSVFPVYRLALMAIGSIIAVLLWLFIERTQLGAVVRAGVDDAEMVRGLGIDLPNVFSAIFALGAYLAGLSGVLAGPILGVTPGSDFTVLLLAFAVVVIGGLGSMKGAFLGSLFIGLVDNFGKALIPQFSLFTIFVPMAIVLAVRPTGLFGKG